MVAAKRLPALVTGVLPHDEIGAFLEQRVVPGFWPGSRLVSVEVTRSRFTPGEECAAIASLTLDPEPAGRQRIVVTFATRHDLQKALDTHRKAMNPPSDLPPLYSPELGCLGEVFPSDWRLPALRGAMSPEAMLPALLNARGEWPSAATSLEVKLLRYRPHSRAVVLYTARDADNKVVAEAVGKVYRGEGKAKRMWKVLEAIGSRSAAASLAPEPLDRAKGSALLLMSKVPGRSLQAILNNPQGDDPYRLMRLAARSLCAFHAIPAEDFKKRKVSKDIDDCKEALKKSGVEGLDEIEAAALVKALKHRAEELPPLSTPALVHGAFKPSALIVEGDVARFVDLDACSAGDPARDAGCFLAKLRALSLSPGQEQLEVLADEFLRAYTLESEAGGLVQRARFYEAVFLAEMGLKHLNTSWRGESDASPGRSLLLAARQALHLSYL